MPKLMRLERANNNEVLCGCLVSALISKHEDAATVQVVNKLFDEDIGFLYSDDIEKEYAAVLNRPKFNFSKENINYLLGSIRKYGILINPKASGTILPDMNDLPFYELVLEKKDDHAYLVTGNIKHFPKEPFIVSPKELLKILDNEQHD